MKKKDRDESLKGKSPSKTANVGTSREIKKVSKGKCTYISFITRGASRENLPLKKGAMKRKIAEMMAIYKKDVSTSTKVPDWSMLGF